MILTRSNGIGKEPGVVQVLAVLPHGFVGIPFIFIKHLNIIKFRYIYI